MSQEVDMCEEIQTHRLTFVLNPDNIWNSYNSDCRRITETDEWKEVKFLNDDASSLNSDIESVPNNCGGVYLFILKGQIVPTSHVYILYVGRVKHTSNQNLRKRFREYFKDDRPKIKKMRNFFVLFYYKFNSTNRYERQKFIEVFDLVFCDDSVIGCSGTKPCSS